MQRGVTPPPGTQNEFREIPLESFLVVDLKDKMGKDGKQVWLTAATNEVTPISGHLQPRHRGRISFLPKTNLKSPMNLLCMPFGLWFEPGILERSHSKNMPSPHSNASGSWQIET